MEKIFQQRREQFLARCLKYARYVFNDHFVLVLMVFLGFLALQYRELLQHFPEQPWVIILMLAGLSLLLFFAGQLASYLEPADQQFLLVKEGEITGLFQKAARRQFFFWGLVQLLGQVLFLPIYLKLGVSIPVFLFYLILLTVGKYMFIQSQLRQYTQQGVFQWEKAIAAETKRKQSILQFFALFTTVKGITTSVKRRAYLDGLLQLVAKQHKRTWDYLYARAFLRSGDFLGLSIRLLVLSLLALVTIELDWLAVGLVVLLDYLLLFQLLPLFHVYDYQYLASLYPIAKSDKIKSFQRFISWMMYGIVLFQILLGFVFVTAKIYLVIFLLAGIFLGQIYLPIKARKWID